MEFLYSEIEASAELHAGIKPRYTIINGQIKQYTKILHDSKEVEHFVDQRDRMSYGEYIFLGEGKPIGEGPIKKEIHVFADPRNCKLIFNVSIHNYVDGIRYEYQRRYNPENGILDHPIDPSARKAMQDPKNITILHS